MFRARTRFMPKYSLLFKRLMHKQQAIKKLYLLHRRSVV